jgi:hypothetical protein
VKGIWTSYWNIKVLLPNVSTSSLSLSDRRNAIRRKRLSQFRYSLHSAHMASGANHKFNERSFWGSVETGACATHRPPRIIADSCLFHGFTEALFRQHWTIQRQPLNCVQGCSSRGWLYRGVILSFMSLSPFLFSCFLTFPGSRFYWSWPHAAHNKLLDFHSIILCWQIYAMCTDAFYLLSNDTDGSSKLIGWAG